MIGGYLRVSYLTFSSSFSSSLAFSNYLIITCKYLNLLPNYPLRNVAISIFLSFSDLHPLND